MKVETLSIVVGTDICNANCPFCISKQTGLMGLKKAEYNWSNVVSACDLASQCGATTALITGKGEPTLYPTQVWTALRYAYKLPIKELQTNGILFHTKREEYEKHLKNWKDARLNLVALSVVSIHDELNEKIYGTKINLKEVIELLHAQGLSVRLSAMLMKDYIDTTSKIDEVINWCRDNKVEQLTLRNITKIDGNTEVHKFTEENQLSDGIMRIIHNHLKKAGKLLKVLSYGAEIYDIGGQNVCLSNCLTRDTSEDLRQLIYMPDGHIYYDWKYKGAILL